MLLEVLCVVLLVVVLVVLLCWGVIFEVKKFAGLFCAWLAENLAGGKPDGLGGLGDGS